MMPLKILELPAFEIHQQVKHEGICLLPSFWLAIVKF